MSKRRAVRIKKTFAIIGVAIMLITVILPFIG